jgi:hypothetical protein
MQNELQISVDKRELTVAGPFPRTARLTHEWFEFWSDPRAMAAAATVGESLARITK